MTQIIQEMRLDEKKSTAGTFRYFINGGERAIDTLYVRRTAFGGETPPAKIKVFIQESK